MLTGGQEWPDLINRLVTPSSRATTCVGFIKYKHCYIPFVFIALGAVSRVNQVIPTYCLSISTMYPWHGCLVVSCSSMSPCWTRWWVGAWLINIHNSKMSQKTQSNSIDRTLKRVHTEVGDFSSSDEESITYTKKTKVTTSNTWPWFVIISSTDDGALKKLSPFAIQKGLVGLAGEPKSVKTIKDGSLLVECCTDSHSKCLLKATLLCNIHIKVTPHLSLNTERSHPFKRIGRGE